VQVDSTNRYTAVSVGDGYACGIRTTYALYCWGANGSGQLGIGSLTSQDLPAAVTGGAGWTAVSAGTQHTCAIRRTTNTLYCWGSNGSGELGVGSTTRQTSPVQVDSANTFADVAAGDTHTCAIRSAGTLHCWGDNTYGQLGLGTTASRTSPGQVGSVNTWYQVLTGFAHTCAAGADRSVWCWGSNTQGQLGQGDSVDRTSPVRADGLISRNLAVGWFTSYAVVP
jgi:alpha-tubulin suppressor-like RCC1 family protein